MGAHDQANAFTKHPGQQGPAGLIDSLYIADVHLHVPCGAVLSPLPFQFRHGFVSQFTSKDKASIATIRERFDL